MSFTALILFGVFDYSGILIEEICFEFVVAAACVVGGFKALGYSQFCDLLCES